MTDEQFETIALTIKAAYPHSNVLPDPYSMKVWYRALGDLDYNDVSNAVAEHMCTSQFPPSIAEIRKCCAKCKSEIPDWSEAWERVQKAIRYYGAYRDDEAMESLDEVTRAAVRRMGYKSLCYAEQKNAETDRAQFREIYNLVARPVIESSQWPPAVLEARESTRKKYIGDSKPEPPKLIDYSAEIERVMACRADPEHVSTIVEEAKRSLEAGIGDEKS